MNKTVFGIVIFLVGLVTGVAVVNFTGSEQVDDDEAVATGARADREILYWVAPMDSNYRRDEPGKSPMGMDLVPVYADAPVADATIVTISPEVVNNLGVRTDTASRRDLSRRIDTVGYIDYDETLINHVHTRTDGWIEKLQVRAEGEQVDRGQLLFEIYSPQLVNAQEEYLQALAGGNRLLTQASRDRLIALDITESQIQQLEKTRKVSQYVKFYAPRAGIISTLNIREGMFVSPQTEVMSIASLDHVWLLVEVVERQSSWVKVGQAAEARLPSMPGEVWEGEVEYIYPDLDPKTRTLRVRMRFDNPYQRLMPNMYAHVAIHSDAIQDALCVPRQALIREGNKQRVIMALGNGRFQPRDVMAGIESGDYIEIQSGLQDGDEIVVSSQFLLDSESSSRASMQRMQPMAANDHDDVVMGSEQMPDNDNEIMASGTVKAVDAGGRELNITHEPIPELNWPVMTMDFGVTDAVDLDVVQPGDTIHFNLQQDEEDNTRYIITNIHVME